MLTVVFRNDRHTTLAAPTSGRTPTQSLPTRNLTTVISLPPAVTYILPVSGALAWDTSQRTVKENIDRYLAAGYPLAWMVVGSGFWPHDEERLHETTSFGLYDKTLYPDPAAFIAYFHSKGIKYLQGLRTTFIVDGPFSAEGVKDRYFVEEAGKARVLQFGWPKSPIYFLDWTKPQAVTWFADLVRPAGPPSGSTASKKMSTGSGSTSSVTTNWTSSITP